MRLVVTGTPGVGKTSLAKKLSKYFNLILINEKDFALKNSIGTFNDDNELEIPLKEFEKKANDFLLKNDNILFEGHLLCEIRLKVDKIILLRINPEELEYRLESRGYGPEKIMDNVFCEGIDFCKKKVLKNYSSNQIIELFSQNSEQNTFLFLLDLLAK